MEMKHGDGNITNYTVLQKQINNRTGVYRSKTNNKWPGWSPDLKYSERYDRYYKHWLFHTVWQLYYRLQGTLLNYNIIVLTQE